MSAQPMGGGRNTATTSPPGTEQGGAQPSLSGSSLGYGSPKAATRVQWEVVPGSLHSTSGDARTTWGRLGTSPPRAGPAGRLA